MSNRKIRDYYDINTLYMGYFNESDFVKRAKLKKRIQEEVSPKDMLMYSWRSAIQFEAFREIFSLDILFQTLINMEERREDISWIRKSTLLIDGIDDIYALNRLTSSDRENTMLKCLTIKIQGNDLFKYGNVKKIGRYFPSACVNFINIEEIDALLQAGKDYKGVPIVITIDNMGELPLDKLEEIEKNFDVNGIRILEDKDIKKHRVENRPISLEDYKKVREFIDEGILKKLYVHEGQSQKAEDLQLATQIIYLINDSVGYDHEFRKKEELMSEAEYWSEYIQRSNVMGAVNGLAICGGKAEFARNALACVNIGCKKIYGENISGRKHAWNQIKLGKTWFNADLTAAAKQVTKGEESGHLFMSDEGFFGNVRMEKFDIGKMFGSTGECMEVEVEIGRRKKAYSETERCPYYISPYITRIFLQRAREYADYYEKYGSSPDYKGAVPYIGSSVEKKRTAALNNRGQAPSVPTGR